MVMTKSKIVWVSEFGGVVEVVSGQKVRPSKIWPPLKYIYTDITKIIQELGREEKVLSQEKGAPARWLSLKGWELCNGIDKATENNDDNFPNVRLE